MNFKLIEKPLEFCTDYSRIPISFTVREIARLDRLLLGSPGPIDSLRIERPYEKHYDAVGDRPADWPARWDLSKWALVAACIDGEPVGAAAIVLDCEGMHLAAGHTNAAIVWDVRVAPNYRGQGIGTALLEFAETKARRFSKQEIVIETQNINVPACRFYASKGYVLASVNHFVYPQTPDEVQLIWSKVLS